MKRYIFVFFVLFFAFFVSGVLAAEENSDSLQVASTAIEKNSDSPELVTITGKIIWLEYKESFGSLIIEAVDEKFQVLASTKIFSPGEYALEVPRSAGEISLSFDLFNKDVVLEKKVNFKKNFPMKLDSDHIDGVDIEITGSQPNPLYNFEGKMVEISGQISFKDYNDDGETFVHITKKFVNKREAQIKKLVLPEGVYSVKIPENFGKIFIWAVHLSAKERWTSKVVELEVGNSDLTNIDLNLDNK